MFMIRRHHVRLAASAATFLVAACSGGLGPDGSLRTIGILQFEDTAAAASLSAEPGGVDGSVRWDVPPDDGVAFPPNVLDAPDTVAVGQTFGVIVRTIGPNGCWSADGIDVVTTGRVVELTPWDLNSGADLCTMIYGYLDHPTTLTLDQPGEWTLRARGRRVRGGGDSDGTVTAERTVFVRPAYTSTQPFEARIGLGDEILVDGIFGILFEDVTEDSRCPVDVVCVWQGNAAVVLGLTMGSGPTVPFTVNTGVDPQSVVHGGYRVTLVGLLPAPVSTSPIDRDDYDAILRVERVQ
jgi:hypothetical protein